MAVVVSAEKFSITYILTSKMMRGCLTMVVVLILQCGCCLSFNHQSYSMSAIRHHSCDVCPLSDTICKYRTRYTSTSQLFMSSDQSSPSPWSSGYWQLTLDFGIDESERDNNSQLYNLLGEGWGLNDARLSLSFEILVNAETNSQENDSWLGGKPTGTIETNSDDCATYINNNGQQNVEISSGQWRIEPPMPLLPTYANALTGQASTLRFYLTMNTPIQRNSIIFPENQLLLLQSNAFRTEQYRDGIQTLLPYQYNKDRAQKNLDDQLDHETGDRRLDGNDVLETLGGMKDAAELVMERDKMRNKWLEVKDSLPKISDSSSIGTGRGVDIDKLLDDEDSWGIWPGNTELMTIERGVIFAVVANKEKDQGFFQSLMSSNDSDKGDPVVVGRWSAVPLFDDDDDLI